MVSVNVCVPVAVSVSGNVAVAVGLWVRVTGFVTVLDDVCVDMVNVPPDGVRMSVCVGVGMRVMVV